MKLYAIAAKENDLGFRRFNYRGNAISMQRNFQNNKRTENDKKGEINPQVDGQPYYCCGKG
jgi:hypothetical protein